MINFASIDEAALSTLLAAFGLRIDIVAQHRTIPGSYWGDPEAGLRGSTLFVRADTPLHSALHESAHFVCMTADRRAALERDAGGDDPEESAVCYLQLLLADELPRIGRVRLSADMDAWGYSFRMGSTQRWFEDDAQDARDWLVRHNIIDAEGKLEWRVRR